MQEQKVSVIVPIYNNELYLHDTLQSIRMQSFKDFEVIAINDGSSDGSEAIIDQFVRADDRFKKISQKNRGVSAARNAGLVIAKGEYVTFVDGDDTLAKDSLKKMYDTAAKFKADLIIGGIQRIDGFTKKVNQRTQRLKEKKQILRDDIDLVHGLSLCNKWFRKEIIDKNQIRLEAFRHLEDGVFLYNFLQYANQIDFCDAIVYNYLKRIPTVTGSVTQRVEKGLLESSVAAYERLEELTEAYSKEFKQELAYRVNSTTFIGDYYKKIWYLDAATEKLLITYISKMWEKQAEAHKKNTISSHPGLELEKGIRTKDELLKDMVYTVAISPLVSEEKINYILKSIYGQSVPTVQIVLDRKFYEYTDESFKCMRNLEFADLGENHREWVEKLGVYTNARYILLLEQDVFFDYDTLATAYKLLRKGKYDVARINVFKSCDGQSLTGYIFASDLIKKNGFVYADNGMVDIKKLCRSYKVIRQKQAPLIMIDDMKYLRNPAEETVTDRIVELKGRIIRVLKSRAKRIIKVVLK